MSKHYAFEFLATKQWALEGDFLERMVSVALREGFEPIGALEAKNGRKLSQITEVRNGVAIIHVNGVISRYANLFHAVCGGVSTEVLAKEFTSAVNESSIKAVILNIDSPGGEANGIHELGEMIHSARSKKPIHAYVGGNGCSAAYWIATSCDRVTLDATALVGSIGTVVSFIKRPDSEGTKRFEFVSSQSPNKRLDPESEQGQTAIQKQLDAMADVFISRVARNMNVTKDKVKNDFGQGGVLIGQDAIDAGMAHELGSLESLIASLSSGKHTPSTKSAQPSSSQQHATHWLALADNTPESVLSAIKEQYPEALSLIENNTEMLSAASALDMAEEANLPMLARKLSTMSEPEATHLVKQAQSLRDVLAASGMQGSFTSMLNHLEDPARLIGMAIHEARAYDDESSDMSRMITSEESHTRTGYNQADIYARRKAR